MYRNLIEMTRQRTEILSFSCYGVLFNIRVSDPNVMERVLRRLPPHCEKQSATQSARQYEVITRNSNHPSGSSQHNLLFGNSTLIAKSSNLNEMLEALESELHLFVAETSPVKVFIHSGVVGWKGKAILIPGSSFSGKSNLVAELVRAGAQYYSDEYAVIDEHGQVYPYLRPLRLRNEKSVRTMDGLNEAPREETVNNPLPVGLVLFSRYRPGATWRPRRIMDGQGLLELLRHTATIRSRPEGTLSVLQKIVMQSRVVKTTRDEAKDVVDALFCEFDCHQQATH
jgi:hypothetical protein